MADGFLSKAGSDLSALGTGAESFLSHPLVQGALAAYLGAIGTPRYEGMGAALSRGGLAGLGGVAQAEQQKYQIPILQAQAQQAQAQLKPLSADDLAQLDQLKAGAIDPLTGKPDAYQSQLIGSLESMYRGQRITPNEFAQAISHINETKQAAELMRAQAAMYGAQVAPAIFGQLYPGLQLPPPPGGMGASVPAASASGGMPPSVGGASPPTAPAPGPGAPTSGAFGAGVAPGTPFHATLPGVGDVTGVVDPSTHIPYYLDKGAKKWIPIS